jgi:glycosyltransferase involved in cell wall biosynthesis
VIVGPRGRAVQMNAGAARARGEVFWFLHADLEPAPASVVEIKRALTEPRIAGGCFCLRFPRSELIYRVSDSLGNLGVNIFGFALGDHGIFCRRNAFYDAGQYPEVPILEDAEIYRRLWKCGRMRQLRPHIVSSPRAYEAHGRFRTTALYFSILVLYVLGLPIGRLNRIYLRFLRRTPPVAETRALAHATR